MSKQFEELDKFKLNQKDIKIISKAIHQDIHAFLNPIFLKINILSFQLNTLQEKINNVKQYLNKDTIIKFQSQFNKLPAYIYKIKLMTNTMMKIKTWLTNLKLREKQVVMNYHLIQEKRKSIEERLNSKLKINENKLVVNKLKTRAQREVELKEDNVNSNVKNETQPKEDVIENNIGNKLQIKVNKVEKKKSKSIKNSSNKNKKINTVDPHFASLLNLLEEEE